MLHFRHRFASGRFLSLKTIRRCVPALLAAVFMLHSGIAAAAERRPNVVVVLTDDQGWGDLSLNGNTNLSTPHIDSLARDGAMFERFYVCPVCSPTRAEFLTGRYHPRGGVYGVSTGGERLDLDERTIADVFKQAGYATAAFGKWHNGSQWPYHPRARGFDEYYGFTSGHWGEYFDPELEHKGKLVKGRGFIVDDLTDHALEFIDRHRTEPFFVYLPFNTPHSPMQVPERFYAKFKDAELKLRGDPAAKEDLEHTRAALAMCENIDWNVGRLLAKLDESQLADDTIVVYFCDNGPNGTRWNGGMKGKKGSTDEGGVRSPLLLRYPQKITAGLKVPGIWGAIDLLPSLAELCGVSLAELPKPLDGQSFRRYLDSSVAAPDRRIFSHWNGKVSMRTPQYRLDADGELFEMQAGPGQTESVTRGRPLVAAELRAAVAAWRKDVLGELNVKAERPYTVGYREFPTTLLPARDGRAHGTIRRSAGAPNCSYFTHWTDVGDRITWEVEVATAGRYEATVYYTCAAADVGCMIELNFGDERCSTKVVEAHDPPARGAEHDRSQRVGESFVKDFRPLKLGELALRPGRGTLTLRCLEKPGPAAIEVRRVVMTLLPTSLQ
jgi:arylsulfatase A-like enzyme